MEQIHKLNDKFYVPLIWGVSILVPVVVGILLTPGLIPPIELGFNPYLLSKINALINSTVSILLMLGVIFIRNRKIQLHRTMMIGAFALSAVFLVLYVLYHLSVGHTPYCGDGLVPANIYYFFLITHIALSVTIIPLASFSIYRALNMRYEKHKKLAKITFPLWLYVAVTGVLVYMFISPCHPI